MSINNNIIVKFNKYDINNILKNKNIINIHFENSIEDSKIFEEVRSLSFYKDIYDTYKKSKYINFLYQVEDNLLFNIIFYKENMELMILISNYSKFKIFEENDLILDYTSILFKLKKIILNNNNILSLEINSSFI
jgi:hypothetical protein